MNNLTNKHKVIAYGLNLHHLILFLENGEFEVENITRLDNKTLQFTISKSHFQKLKKQSIALNYKFVIQKSYGLKVLGTTLLNKLGLFVGIIVCLCFMLNITSNLQTISFEVSNHSCSNLEHCILKQDNKNEMLNVLQKLGIKKGSKLSSLPNNKTIENALVSNFEQISGVSVIRRGVHLKINIIEAKLKDKSNKNLISPVNGIIISASATSGNLKVKAGDFILKDSVLVSQDNNKEICATLTIRAFYSDSLIYDQNQISYKKTGKTKNQTTLTLFGKSFKPSQNINFNFYQCIKYNRYVFFNLFLPLKIQTTCYQELNQVVEVIPFEQSEKTLKNNLETKIKKSLPKNADIKNTTFTTFKEGSKTRLDCYVETYLTIST